VAKIKGDSASFRFIALSDLSPHPVIQRTFDIHHAEKLMKRFDANALRELLVVPDPKHHGKYLVFEGQHRLWAANKLYASNWELPCRIYGNVSDERLADIQLKVSRGTKAWRVFDAFRMKVIQNDPAAIEISAELKLRGLRLVAASKTKGGIAAVGALESIYARGGRDLLARVLTLLIKAWGHDNDAFQASTLRGAALMLGKFNGEVDDDVLASKLKKQGDAASMLGHAKGYAKSARVSSPAATAQLFVRAYNIGRRDDNRLADFH